MDKSICQFCLQLFTDNIISFYDDSVNKLVKTFFVNKNLNAICSPVVCQVCLKNLNSVYNFTLSANENNLKMLDATLEYDDEVCQTCLSPVQDPHVYLYDHSENIAPFSAIQKMLKYCLINLDLAFRQCPIMCNVCWEILKLSYRFLVRCEQNEKKVLQFCKEHNITVVERRNLKELSEFCVGIPVEQSPCANVSENTKETDTRSKMIATCSIASPDHIFSEIKMELEENAIIKGIKTENNGVETDDFSYDILHPYEHCDKLFSIVGNIKIEDINSSNIELPTDVGSRVNISSPACSNSEFCSTTITENEVKKDVYMKVEKLKQKRKQNKIKKCRAANELNTRQEYKCDLCPYSFKKRYAYIRHVATHMTLEECAKNNMLYHCDSCGYKSKHKYALMMHLRRIHQKATCVSSNNTSMTKKSKRYIVIPKSDKFTFKCGYCEFETKVYARLETHAVAHKNTQTKKLYKCEVCGYLVKKKSGISRHVVIHSTLRELSKHNKLYKCDMCDYKAKRKDSLVLHASNVHGKVDKKISSVK